jgi:hypothetical protein
MRGGSTDDLLGGKPAVRVVKKHPEKLYVVEEEEDMRRVSKLGVALGVALLVVGLAAPASAKKGGKPGPPSGTGLEVTVDTGSAMWANSVGDQIPFDITVTNTSGEDLDVVVTWDDTELETLNLAKDASWSTTYQYMVVESDFANAPVSEQSPVTVGTVTATSTGAEVTDSDDAVMTAYPIPPCDVDSDGVVTFGPNSEYSECSFSAEPDSSWMLTTTLQRMPHGKNLQPGATVRDGVPGNWCMVGEVVSNGRVVTQEVYFPGANVDGDIVCEQGGAGGETFPVRNANTFYLATWAGNSVEATPLP